MRIADVVLHSGDNSAIHDAVIIFGFIITFGAAGMFTWAMAPFIRIILEAKPRVVKETTRSSKPSCIPNAVDTFANYCFPLKSDSNDCPSIDAEFDQVIFPKEIKETILDFLRLSCNARRRKAPFRHLLLHGPNGAGKAITAKRLAKVIGIDFAHVSGRDIITTGVESVSQIQTLFSWAKLSTNGNGMLLFFDDAEAFLGSTESSLMNDTEANKNNALSTFLHNMKRIRKDIILVLSTNRDQDLDREVLDCFDERIFLPLPDAKCRNDMINLYFDVCVQRYVYERNQANEFSFKSRLTQFLTRQPPIAMSIEDDMMTGEHLEDVIAATRGFSGDDIRDLMVAMQRALCSSENGRLDFATAWRLVEEMVKHHRDIQARAGEHTLSYLDGDIDLQDVTFV